MRNPNVVVALAVAAIVAIVLSYRPGIPLLPVSIFLLALALIIGAKIGSGS
jgi:hypothetical protein